MALADRKAVFAGRAEELRVLQTELGREAHEANPTRIVNLWGAHGVGKTALVNAFLSRSVVTGQPAGWLRSSSVPQTATVGDLVRILAGSLQTTVPTVNTGLADLISSLDSGSAPHAGLSPPPVDPAPQSFLPVSAADSERSRMARALVKGLSAVFGSSSGSPSSAAPALLIKLGIELDLFDEMSPLLQQWIGRHLCPALDQPAFFDFFFLLTSGAPQAGAGEFLDQHAMPVAVLDLPLSPLTFEETCEGLREAGVAVKSFERIFLETAGWPKRLAPVFADGDLTPEPDALDLDRATGLLAGKTDPQKDRLLAAAFLPECNLESMSLFGGAVAGRAAMAWLQDLPDLARRIRLRPDAFILDAAMRRALQDWSTQNEPRKATECRYRAEIYRQMLEMVPSFEHRQQLVPLAAFQHFDLDLLEAVQPQQAKTLRAFVARFPGYFQRSFRSLTIVEPLKSAVKAYASWIDPARYQSQTEMLRSIWKKKHDSLLQDIDGLEQELAQYEDEKQILFIQIQALNDQIAQQKEYSRPLTQLRPRPSIRLPRRNRIALVPLLFETSGVIGIYVGILFIRVANDAAITYICLGLYLIAWGMFMPTSTQAALQSNAAMPSAPASPAAIATSGAMASLRRQIEENINHLRLQTLTFENKRRRLTQQFAKVNQTLSAAYQKLNEPYV